MYVRILHAVNIIVDIVMMWYWYVIPVPMYSIVAVAGLSLPGSLSASYALYLSRTNGLFKLIWDHKISQRKSKRSKYNKTTKQYDKTPRLDLSPDVWKSRGIFVCEDDIVGCGQVSWEVKPLVLRVFGIGISAETTWPGRVTCFLWSLMKDSQI